MEYSWNYPRDEDKDNNKSQIIDFVWTKQTTVQKYHNCSEINW